MTERERDALPALIGFLAGVGPPRPILAGFMGRNTHIVWETSASNPRYLSNYVPLFRMEWP